MISRGRIVTSVSITNVRDPSISMRCDALVDTGASHLVLPTAWKDRLGALDVLDVVDFETANQATIQGEVCGPVQIQLEGFRPVFNEVVSLSFSCSMNRPITSRRQFLSTGLAVCSAPALLRAGERNAQKDVPWLADVQQPPGKLPADAPNLSPLLVDDEGNKITTLAGWQRRREIIRRWWVEFLKPLELNRKTPALEVVSEDRPGGVVRQLVRYQIEPGMETEAYLLQPLHAAVRRPGVVVLHETVNHSIRQPAGVEGRAGTAFGVNLARRGYVAFCPRNFLWPTNRTLAAHEEARRFHARHPGSKGMAKMLYDARVALDILAGLPRVDPQRLGAIGHSLGAKEVLYLAALDGRVKAAVSSEGGIGTTFSNWDAPWYLGEAIRRAALQHEHHELLALAAPRPFLLVGGDSADGARSWPFITAALPVYRLHGGTPRLGLLNHRRGHSVPPEAERRIYEWMAAYL